MARTVLIVDDHAPFRARLRALLDRTGFEVVGEAADAKSALHTARMLRPQIVVLDIQLPDRDGFAVAEELAHHLVDTTVLLISTRTRSDYEARLSGSTAHAFITKGELTPDALFAALG